MSKSSRRCLAFSPALILLLSAWYTPANALTVPISTCNAAGCSAGVGNPTVGWDGAGLGSAVIDYYVGNPGQPNNGIPTGPSNVSIGLAAFDAAISAAQAIWSAVVDVSWNRTGDAINNPGADIFGVQQSVVYAAPGDHGDGAANAFDGAWNPNTGAGNVLAHAFGPYDISVGNLHLDNAELWVTSGADNPPGGTSATIDLLSILVHEFGHVLGLGHPSGNAGDVMQPLYFGPLTTLSADDILAVRSLYACAGDDCQVCTGPDCPCEGPDCPNGTVPEPGTLFLFGIGLLGLVMNRRRRTS